VRSVTRQSRAPSQEPSTTLHGPTSPRGCRFSSTTRPECSDVLRSSNLPVGTTARPPGHPFGRPPPPNNARTEPYGELPTCRRQATNAAHPRRPCRPQGPVRRRRPSFLPRPGRPANSHDHQLSRVTRRWTSALPVGWRVERRGCPGPGAAASSTALPQAQPQSGRRPLEPRSSLPRSLSSAGDRPATRAVRVLCRLGETRDPPDTCEGKPPVRDAVRRVAVGRGNPDGSGRSAMRRSPAPHRPTPAGARRHSRVVGRRRPTALTVPCRVRDAGNRTLPAATWW